MSKIRVYELAKKLGVPSNTLVDELRALGVEVETVFSTLDQTAIQKLLGPKRPALPPLHKTSIKVTPPPETITKPAPPRFVAPKPEPPKAAPPKPGLPPKPAAPKAEPAKVEAAGPEAKAETKKTRATAKAPKDAKASAEAKVKAPAAKAKKAAAEKEPAKAKTAKAASKKAAPAEEAPAPKVEPVAEAPVAPAAPVEAPKSHPAPVSAPAPAAVPPPAPVAAPRAHPAPAPHPAGVVHAPPRTVAPPPVYTGRSEGRLVRPSPPAQRPGAPGTPRPAQPGARPDQRPGQPSGRQDQRPAGHAYPQRPHPRPGQAAPRPGERPAPGRPPFPGQRPPAAQTPAGPQPVPKPAEPPRPSARVLPPSDTRRKTKRERRMEKLQAKVDRKERLDLELEEARAKAETGEAVFIREGITVKELADKLNVKVKDIIAKLMTRSILATINQPLDSQVAIQVASMFGFAAEVISYEDELVLTQDEGPEEDKVPRAPVVTVMGHVDHGKSSLLEAIHDVDITGKEFGGITQHIGAYKVRHGEREYVFLDTPGHEAFTLMRARGAQVTDIVILVVAADDGVMPQTIEAINHCKAANVPIVVAINKMDKGGANADRVKQELSQQGILTEDWGGEVVSVPVSAKSRMGIEELLEMVALVADMLNLKASPETLANGTVLESRLDRARGPVATVLIQDGTLKVGDLFLCGTTYGHVRGLFDDKGLRLDQVGPSTPVEVLGFSEVPMVGSLFQGMDDEAKARQIASFRKEQEKAKAMRTGKVRLDNVFGAIQQGEIQELALILKADVHGSLEAIAQKVQELSTDEIKINIVHQGVGAVSESDILLASASNALAIGFNVRPERKAVDLAKAEGVEIHLFTVIYDLIDRMKQALTGMLKPIEQEVVLGHAEVRQIFKVSKVGTVAGSIVVDGRIPRAATIRVLRDNVVVHAGKMKALKRFKDDVSEVKDGTECGISLENFNDIKPGDVLEAYEIQIQERTL